MKKMTITAALLLTATMTSGFAKADASKEENIGFISGALSGAAVGGPIGFIVGGVSGVLMGEQVEKANQVDKVQAELLSQKQAYQLIEQQLDNAHQEISAAEERIQTEAQWLTEGLTLNMMFSTNSSTLSTNDKEIIERVATVLAEFPELSIHLDGYADPRGDEQSNLQLSHSRTSAVRNAFIAMGISEERLTSQAHGESMVTVSENDLDGYAMERRVSINFSANGMTSVAQN
jgi:sortase system peptidoglycan-associated protein